MTKTNKVLKASFLSMLVAAFTVASTGAFALTNTTSVVNSGDDVEIESEVSHEVEIDVDNENDAYINQKIDAMSNSGHVTANGNIGGTSVETGNAVTSVEADASANENMTWIGLEGTSTGMNYTDVVNTGDDADIETEVETELEVDVENDNKAFINQKVKSHANTGHVTSNDGIGGTSVDTGNAQTTTDLSADANDNMTLIGLMGDWNDSSSGNLVNGLVVTNTGDDAEIESEVESETEIDVENDNFLSANQYLKGHSNSGWIWANDNIGESEVMTGSALLASKMTVGGNSNTTGIGGSMLSPSSTTMSDIVNTGDDLESESETEIEMEVEVENDNKLIGGQFFHVMSNSGWTWSNDNIGGTSVDSGVSGAGAEVDFGGNENTTVLGLLGSLLTLLTL